MNCVTCDECKQEILDNSADSQKFDEFIFFDDDSNYRYFFLHESCVEQSSLHKSYKNELKKYQKANVVHSGSTQTISILAAIATFVIVFIVCLKSFSLFGKDSKDYFVCGTCILPIIIAVAVYSIIPQIISSLKQR